MNTQKNFNEMNDETRVKSTPVAKSTKTKGLWHNVLVGGVPGIIIGAGGIILSGSALAGTEHELASGEFSEKFDVLEAHSVNDDMSFKEAFAAARAEVGPGGAFVWHGNVYETYRADDPEWMEMNQEERTAHCQQVLSQVHAEPYTPTENEPVIEFAPDEEEFAEEGIEEEYAEEPVEESILEEEGSEEVPVEGVAEEAVEETAEESVEEPVEQTEEESVEETEEEPVEEAAEEPVEEPAEPAAEEEVGEIDVHIIGVGQVEGEDGSSQEAGFGEVDGAKAIFTDTTGDGEVDTVLVDVNGDGAFSEDEILDAGDLKLSIEDMTAAADENNAPTTDDNLGTDMPDYTNDADVSDIC